MGFLKFLKRDKGKESLDDLDLPPAPPPLEGLDDKDIGMNFDDIKMDDMPKDMPDFEMDEKDLMPEAPNDGFGPVRENASVHEPEPLGEEAYNPLLQQSQMAEEEHAERPVAHIKNMHDHYSRGKSIYLRVDKFRMLLGTINVIRSDLRKSDDALVKLEDTKSKLDGSFDKIKASLHDMQKKLIFIDKTLFKGD